MSEWSARRRFPRYAIHLLCQYEVPARAGHGCDTGWTLELSEGGACLELGEQLQPQTSLRLRLQSDRGPIEVEAQVIWAGQPGLPGGILHGVAFTQIATNHLEILREVLRAPRINRRTEVRLPLDLHVTCHHHGQDRPVLYGRTGDISREGLLLLLPEVLPPGTALRVTLHAPSEPLTIEGKIIWTEPLELWTRGEPIAHGFQFTSYGWSIPLGLAILIENPTEGLHRPPSSEGEPPSE
jgi:c-di-GMP-binding flagellar brake protein YcgR